MVKNPDNNYFEINFNLPRIKHQFKFVINGNWCSSPDYPQINDGQGNIKNEIDLGNYVSEQIKKEEEEKKDKKLKRKKMKKKKFKEKEMIIIVIIQIKMK